MNTILSIQNVSKQYQIRSSQSAYLSLRDQLTQFKNPFKKQAKETFYALNDVSFNVQAGESVAIVGKNGAGKSTLLKILSRITPPTTGRIGLNGRIASLLEVGTGFHPELTGRENVYLNGSILGMKRREIDAKFDDIVGFSGTEKFLNTPLKHFSSGMQLRLAFSVAAFLEPEILVIDEVLAVGDAEFQKKCINKVQEVNDSGRTILFVSHNMAILPTLCSRGILLEKGQIKLDDQINTVIDHYNAPIQENDSSELINKEHFGSKNEFIHFSMRNAKNEIVNQFNHNQEIDVKINMCVPEFSQGMELSISLYDKFKRRVFTINEPLKAFKLKEDKTIELKLSLEKEFITPGRYSWLMCINHPGVANYDLKNDIYSFQINDVGSKFAAYDGLEYGNVWPRYTISQL